MSDVIFDVSPQQKGLKSQHNIKTIKEMRGITRDGERVCKCTLFVYFLRAADASVLLKLTSLKIFLDHTGDRQCRGTS